MAAPEVLKLVEPVSEEAPCGPDLFLEGDADAYNFEARIEGVLPESFFSFDRAAVDLPAEIGLANRICGKSKDLRIIAPLAKLHILNRDFANFVHVVAGVAELLKTRWDAVHPAYEGGEYCFRTIAVRTLDDAPHTILPLQAAPLFKTRRFGVVTHRTQMLLEGIVKPRKSVDEGEEDEKVPSGADFRGAINDADIEELVTARDLAATLNTAVTDIEAAYDAAASEGRVRLKNLKAAADSLLLFLDSSVRSKDPGRALVSEPALDGSGEQGEAGEAGPATNNTGIASAVEAMNAIRAAFSFFNRHEPSSPARLWLAQAMALEGKSFYDSLQALTPEFAGQATVKLGRELPLTLPVERLAEILSQMPTEDAEPADEPVEDTSGGSWQSDADTSAEGDGSVEPPGEGGETSETQPLPPPQPAAKREPAMFHANTRPQAVQLIDQAGAYLRNADPSSPIPLLLDQARNAAGRDFLSLLRDVLPAHALRIDE